MATPEPGRDAAAEEPTTAETDEPVEFTNRAARCAKGKATSPRPHGEGQRLGGRGSVQSPRQYGNRRSG